MSSGDVVKAVLARNRRHIGAPAAAHYDYTCPSPSSYPFQWQWDSAFHAIALATYDPVRAQAEITTLLAAKQPSGFLPHIVVWPEELRAAAARKFTSAFAESGWHSATAQPPVLPLAVERVWRVSRDRQWLGEVLPDLVDVMSWWRSRRDPTSSGLVSIFQPDESGLDMSPKFDALLGLAGGPEGDADVAARWHLAMRDLFTTYAEEGSAGRDPDANLTAKGRFVWQDVMVNAIYAHSSRALARLLDERSHPETADTWRARAAATGDALLQYCWDGRTGAFYDTYLVASGADGSRTRELARVLTASSLFPLILEDLPSDIAATLVAHLTDPHEFWLPYPVPSVAATESSFDPGFATGATFRGSSWVNLNWYLCLGLRTHGYADVAAELARRTREMVALSGLRECYGPLDGEGHGAHDFSWSSLVLDLPGA